MVQDPELNRRLVSYKLQFVGCLSGQSYDIMCIWKRGTLFKKVHIYSLSLHVTTRSRSCKIPWLVPDPSQALAALQTVKPGGSGSGWRLTGPEKEGEKERKKIFMAPT